MYRVSNLDKGLKGQVRVLREPGAMASKMRKSIFLSARCCWLGSSLAPEAANFLRDKHISLWKYHLTSNRYQGSCLTLSAINIWSSLTFRELRKTTSTLPSVTPNGNSGWNILQTWHLVIASLPPTLLVCGACVCQPQKDGFWPLLRPCWGQGSEMKQIAFTWICDMDSGYLCCLFVLWVMASEQSQSSFFKKCCSVSWCS